ncbi:peptidase S13 [Paracoccus sp. S-4012]|nr:peptidase S13 [Paracoccus sp. S-4012]
MAAGVARPVRGDVYGVRPPPKPPQPQPAAADLIAQAGLGGSVGFAVLDAATGLPLGGMNADLPLPPASTLKAVTALYALDRLGPRHRFVTRVLTDGDRLILAGGGDPVLDTDRLAELAQRASVATGATRLAVWGGALPRLAEIAPEQDDHLSYNPALSGMMLNFNRVHLGWRSGPGGPQFSLEARAARLSPPVGSVSIAAAERTAALFDWETDGTVEGWHVARDAVRRPGSRWLPVRHPELYAGDVFRTLLRAEGLALEPAEVLDELPPAAREIARTESPPLSEILRGMLDYSTNLTAEAVGLAASGEGSLVASARAMEGWLAGQGVRRPFRFADHSGLSAASRISAAALAGVMAGPGRHLRALLPQEPLRDATGKTLDAPVSLLAKTGTLNFVSNLAGLAARTDAPARELAFAILCADEARRAASQGRESPEGSAAWVTRAKHLQSRLIEGWTAEWG